MDAVSLLTLLHLLLFCYWLGGDIGVFYSSGFVVDGARSRQERLMAAKIMLAIDLVPRICMSVMLTVGGLLAHYLGVAHPGWQLAAIVLLGPLWLSSVLVLHFMHGAAFHARLAQLDRLLRWLVILAIVLSQARVVFTDSAAVPPWLTAKLLGFAFLVFCGLMVRRGFGGFAAGYTALLAGEPTAAENRAMAASLRRVRPWVLAIWAVLVLEAWLGIARPMLW